MTNVYYQPVILRVEPHAIPRVRAAFADAVDRLTPALEALGRDGYIKEPWLGDPVSAQVQRFYNERVMDAPDGPYHALLAYLDRLTQVRDELRQAELTYRLTEGENSELWGRQ